MSDQIEERLRRLEKFRFQALGFINAQNTLITDLWSNFIDSAADPLKQAKRLQKAWLADVDKPSRRLRGGDPFELDLVHQEYRAALEMLTDELIRKLQGGPVTDLDTP
jgi:hypothetical protein